MTTDPTRPTDDSPDWLDQALARHLPAPSLPAGLQVRLQAMVRHDALVDLQQRHAALEQELAQTRRRLRQGQLAASLRVLGLAVGASFASGALAAWTLPLWLPWLGEPAAGAMPLLALGLGVSAGAVAVVRGRSSREGI